MRRLGWSVMSTPLQREGSHLDELMRNIYTEYGDVTVSNVERVRTGGVGGFFERTFAPAGLKRIQHQLLANLKADVEG